MAQIFKVLPKAPVLSTWSPGGGTIEEAAKHLRGPVLEEMGTGDFESNARPRSLGSLLSGCLRWEQPPPEGSSDIA